MLPLIRTLRSETPLGVSVCLGSLDAKLYAELKAAGASIYIIKFEIADPAMYADLHAPGNQAERLEHIRALRAAGWQVSSDVPRGPARAKRRVAVRQFHPRPRASPRRVQRQPMTSR